MSFHVLNVDGDHARKKGAARTGRDVRRATAPAKSFRGKPVTRSGATRGRHHKAREGKPSCIEVKKCFK